MIRLRNRLKQLFSGSFIRDVSKLSLGTLVGRVITVAALPLLTRLYSPQDFALLATYVALVSTVSVAACLRFEIAIPLAESNDDAKYLLMLALVALTGVTIAALILVWFLPLQITGWIKQPAMQPYLWIIPLGIAAIGVYSVAQYWATRARCFSQIAKTRMSQALIGVGTSLTLGWAGYTPLGLLLGNMFNASAGGFSLTIASLRNKKTPQKKMNLVGFQRILKKYRRYPIYSTFESLFNTAGIQISIILIASQAGVEAGFLMLAIQIVAAPVTLLGGAVSQVYISRAPEVLKEGGLKDFTKSIMRRLFRIGAGPLIMVGLLAPVLTPFVFGASWARTGVIVTWIVPWIIFQFIVSPISMALHITGNQVYAMLLQAFGLFLRVGALMIAILVQSNHIVEVFAISSAIFYVIYLLAVLKVVSE